MKIKCLPLCRWMARADMRDDCIAQDHYVEITPRIGRPGRYLQGRFEWFEINEGRAWECKKGYMALELCWFNAMEMNHKQAAALEAIVQEKLATKKQKQLLFYYRGALSIRNSSRNARKYRLRYKK
jgi:hypothetical protein